MRTRWMLLTAAGLAWAVCVSPKITFGQPGVPPLPADAPSAPPTEPPAVQGDAPAVPIESPVEILPEEVPEARSEGPVHPPIVIVGPASLETPDLPQLVRPRYGSVLTNGAYMPVRVAPRPAATVHWQPGGREGRVGSPYYYSAPGQEGPLYTVHASRGVPWGYDHSVFEYHFGPGYYRDGEAGHYRFPYYTYRAPWYSPGPPVYNRFTNLPW